MFQILLPIGTITLISIIYFMNNPVKHEHAFRMRSYYNWMFLGLTYAFLYMGRYNLTVAKKAFGTLMTNEQFGTIFGVGAVVYGISFIINGPLTDRLGGKRAMLIGATGSGIANVLLGIITYTVMTNKDTSLSLFMPFVIIYAVNMYFQSFGAVSIVKVNASWFHIKERGVFGGIFGTLISLGIFLAFDLTGMILNTTKLEDGSSQVWYAFFVPAGILFLFAIIDLFIIKDRPSQAGFADLETGDASTPDDDGKKHSSIELYKKLLTHPVILMMIAIEFCSGVLRNGIMHWGTIFAKDVAKIDKTDWVFSNWGLVLMIAGISGGFFAGFVSDKFFQSRRGPSAFFLYAGMLVGFAVMIFAVRFQWYGVVGFLSFFLSMCVIGVHGMISGTASMDFGGKKGAATTAGIIDGFVYLGTGLQSVAIGFITTSPSLGWNYWPIFLIPFTAVGLFFTYKIWSAFPNAVKKSSGH